jgi:D-alanyl-D-alanine carboxypeptidase
VSADLGALIEALQPFAQRLVHLGGVAGVQPRVTSTLRSHAQQQRLYAAYLRGESKYPVAPPGRSAHEFGFAFDMVAATPEDLHDLGTVWRQWGGVWSPADEVHFEYPGFVGVDLPEDLPVSKVTEVVRNAAQAVDDLPWWLTIFAPIAASTAHGTIQEESQGSPGARTLCRWGVKSFC